MKEKEPMMDIDEVEEVDIENMSMEELREFIAAAEAEVSQYNHNMLRQRQRVPPSSKKRRPRPLLKS